MRHLLSFLAAAAVIFGGIFLWNRSADARVNGAIEENNRLAGEAAALVVTEHGVEIGELRSTLANADTAAARMERDTTALGRRNRRLERELAGAVRSNATLQASLDSRQPTVFDLSEGIFNAEFDADLESNGDVLGYHAALFVPLDSPETSILNVDLYGELTIDTRLLWERQVPVCQVSVRHGAVSVVPGDCVLVLGDSPIERAANRIDLPPVTGFAIGGGLIVVGFLACVLVCP